MRRCPRCLIEFDDASKICRFCGGILDKVAEERSPRADPARTALPSVEMSAIEEWSCPKCGEVVPGTFTVCWNCGGEDKEESESRLVAEPQEQVAVASQSKATRTSIVPAPLPCAACGSTKIIPDVHVSDQGQHSSGQLRVVVYSDPDALLFKGRLHGTLTANVCGQCGHVQLRVGNPGELYEHYQKSRGK